MDGGRFFMLETIREFAEESLETSGEATVLRRRHADYLLAEATDAAPGLASGRIEQFDRLESDLPNYRAAFAWLLEAAPDDALRLADALRDFWFARGYLHEGRGWFAAALATDAEDDALRARMLSAASILASLQADWPETRRLAEESTRVSAALGDPTAVAQSLLTLGRVYLAEGAPDRALELFDEADAVATAAGAFRMVGMARFNSGYLELGRGDYAAAQKRFESAHALFTEIDNTYGAARSLAALGADRAARRSVRGRRRTAARKHRTGAHDGRPREPGLGAGAARRRAVGVGCCSSRRSSSERQRRCASCSAPSSKGSSSRCTSAPLTCARRDRRRVGCRAHADARRRRSARARSAGERLVGRLQHVGEILVAELDAARPEALQHRADR